MLQSQSMGNMDSDYHELRLMSMDNAEMNVTATPAPGEVARK